MREKHVLLLLIFGVVFAAGCVGQVTDSNYVRYQYNGTTADTSFSFEYPAANASVEVAQATVDWNGSRVDAPNLLVYAPDEKERIFVQLLALPNFEGLTLEQSIEKESEDISRELGLRLVLNETISLGGAKGRKLVYNYTSELVTGRFRGTRRMAVAEKGEYHYVIHLTHFLTLNATRATAAYEQILKSFRFEAPGLFRVPQ